MKSYTTPINYTKNMKLIIDSNEVSGMQDAGHWEAMNRISKYYLMYIKNINYISITFRSYGRT